jgi:hypothetical protein
MPTSGVSTFRSDREMSVDNSPRLACGRGGTAKRWVRELLVLRGKTPHPRLRRTLSPVSRSQGLYFQCDLLATQMLVQSGAAGGWGSPRRGPLSTVVTAKPMYELEAWAGCPRHSGRNARATCAVAGGSKIKSHSRHDVTIGDIDFYKVKVYTELRQTSVGLPGH